MNEQERIAFEEKCLSSELVFDGKVMRVFRDVISLPDGSEGFREYAKHVGAVAVLPLTDEGDVICVRQYRYAHGCMLTEIPAGKLDSPDEDHIEAALRELREETGARCQTLTHLGLYRATVAILDEKIDLYLAEGLTFGDTDLDDDEFLEVERIPLEKMLEMVMSGKITDGKTQVAVLKTCEILRRRAAT